MEWTMEAEDTDSRVIRGGSYYDNLSWIADRTANVPTDIESYICSFRPTLYVK